MFINRWQRAVFGRMCTMSWEEARAAPVLQRAPADTMRGEDASAPDISVISNQIWIIKVISLYDRLVLPFERHQRGEEDRPLPSSKPRKPYKRNLDGKVNKAEGKRKRTQLESEVTYIPIKNINKKERNRKREKFVQSSSSSYSMWKWPLYYFLVTRSKDARGCLPKWSRNTCSFHHMGCHLR